MTLAVDITDGRGFGYEARHELLPKKSNCICYGKGFIVSNTRIKIVCVDMCSLVMNICSCDVIKYYYKTLNNLCLHTYIVF